MTSISKRLREIDEELAELYREKRILELEQKEYWKQMGWYNPIFEGKENFETLYGY